MRKQKVKEEPQKWTFVLYKTHPKTGEVMVKATCKTRSMNKTAVRTLAQLELKTSGYDFWELI